MLFRSAPIKLDNFEPSEAAFRNAKKYSEWVFTYPADLMLRKNADSLNSEPSKGQNMQTAGAVPSGGNNPLGGAAPIGGIPFSGAAPMPQNPINSGTVPAGNTP